MEEKKNLIYGIRAVIEAIKAGKEIDTLLLKAGQQGDLYRELFSLIKEYKIFYKYVPVEKLNRITRSNHQGVIAFISNIEYHTIEQIIPALYEEGKNPLLLILDSITDVRNFGAIVRTAECAGIHAIIIPYDGTAQINADAIKTSAGALYTMKICRVKKLSETANYLKSCGIQVLAATEKASQTIYQSDFTTPSAIILGSEDKGISNELIRIADTLMAIPMWGNIASLNVSVAAGIIIYEAIRQRNV